MDSYGKMDAITVGIVTITNSVEFVSRKSSLTFIILSLSFSNLSACKRIHEVKDQSNRNLYLQG